MKEDPPLDARCRDKFLVQSVAILPDQELGNVASIVCFPHKKIHQLKGEFHFANYVNTKIKYFAPRCLSI